MTSTINSRVSLFSRERARKARVQVRGQTEAIRAATSSFGNDREIAIRRVKRSRLLSLA